MLLVMNCLRKPVTLLADSDRIVTEVSLVVDNLAWGKQST